MVVVAFDPFEINLMLAVDFEETHPQIRILFSGKSFLFPTEDPSFFYGIHHIFRIRNDQYFGTRVFYLFQTDNNAKQFHSIIGGVAESFVEFFFISGADQFHYNAITAVSGISFSSAVGVYVDLVGHFRLLRLLDYLNFVKIEVLLSSLSQSKKSLYSFRKILVFEFMDFNNNIICGSTIFNIYFLLQYEFAFVVMFIDIMDRNSGFFLLIFQNGLVYFHSVHAFSAVFWQ